MKKAKIILTAVGLFAVLGGVFAFKAMRSSGNFVYTTLTGYVQGTVTYRLPDNEDFCINTTPRAWTTTFVQGQSPVAAFSTNGAATTVITLTSGALTKTIPLHTCIPYTSYTTANL